jgi:putative protease
MAELLAPAGNVEALDAAIGEGADAVYMGLKSFNARLRSSNFAWNQFEAAVESVHRQKKKIFVTVNTVVEEWELERLYRFLAYLNKIGPDGIIVQDMGVIRMVQEFFPNLRMHASTQLNAASANAVNLLGKAGLKRVVLARELGLEEVTAIRQRTNSELEVFVHGALCVSESGLCLFSSYLGGKSANRGMCTQACRRFYSAEVPGGLAQGYYFSPHDLQLIEKIPDLVKAGVDSFKIEGRMKSAEYVGSVTAAYRYVLNNWETDKKGAIAAAKRMLSTDFARSKTMYWYESSKADNLLDPKQAGGTGIYLGKIERMKTLEVRSIVDGQESSVDESDQDTIEHEASNPESVKEKTTFAVLRGGSYDPDAGDSIRLHRKDDSNRESYKVKQVKTIDNERWIDIPQGFSTGDNVYLIQTKSMSKRYPHVLPHDLSRFRSQPGAQQLPVMDLTSTSKEDLKYFPEGIYVQVSTVKDLFGVINENPVRYILELNSETQQSLIEKKETLPVSKKQIFISLDPFCPQAVEDNLAQTVSYLLSEGYRNWIVNNPAHLALFRDSSCFLIAGPYLYTFNRWAVSFLENQKLEAFISPYENSRLNLESTFDAQHRKRVLVPLFAYPALFRMRFQLPSSYDFTFFQDKEGGVFKALSTADGSFVLPEKPFSILDKWKFLQTAGFTHFLIDLSKTQITKVMFKQILKALYKGEPLEDISRFNWKDGFYSPEKIENFKNAAERAKKERSAAPLRGKRQPQPYKTGYSKDSTSRSRSFDGKKGRSKNDRKGR